MENKKSVSLKNILLILAMFASVFVLIGSFKHNIQVDYISYSEKIEFSFANPIWGGKNFSYAYYSVGADIFGRHDEIKQVFINENYYCPPVPVLLIAVVFSIISSIAAFVVSIAVKNEKARKITVISLFGLEIVVTVLLFMSKLFERVWLVNRINDYTTPFVIGNSGHIDLVKSNHVFWSGFWSLVSSISVGLSLIVKDKKLSDINLSKIWEKVCSPFVKFYAWLKKNLKKKPKKEKKQKPVPEKKPLTEVPVEVVVSPQVDVNEEPKPTSEPEIERVSPSTQISEEAEEKLE